MARSREITHLVACIVTLLAMGVAVSTAQETQSPQALAYFNRGVVSLNKGDTVSAIADFDQAIQLDPKYVDAYVNRGLVFLNKGDNDRAIADFNRAIQLDPNNVLAYNNRGVAYYRQGASDRAISDYNKAIQLDPKYAQAYNNRGLVYSKNGDNKRAIADYDNGAKFAGAHSSTTDTAYAITPWDSVVSDYHLKGFTESTFNNRHGNVWNVWTSGTSGNTLIWSKTASGGRGQGFNCFADARPNFWGNCTRYDLRSGQAERKVSVRIVNGTVIDRPV